MIPPDEDCGYELCGTPHDLSPEKESQVERGVAGYVLQVG